MDYYNNDRYSPPLTSLIHGHHAFSSYSTLRFRPLTMHDQRAALRRSLWPRYTPTPKVPVCSSPSYLRPSLSCAIPSCASTPGGPAVRVRSEVAIYMRHSGLVDVATEHSVRLFEPRSHFSAATEAPGIIGDEVDAFAVTSERARRVEIERLTSTLLRGCLRFTSETAAVKGGATQSRSTIAYMPLVLRGVVNQYLSERLRKMRSGDVLFRLLMCSVRSCAAFTLSIRTLHDPALAPL